MSFGIYDGCPGPGFWERDNSHFPLPMSRHLWELFLPSYDAGTRRGLARYGSLIDHFDFARIRGRLYLKSCYVKDAQERSRRIQASEEALHAKLWRKDREQWRELRRGLRDRLLPFSEIDPAQLDCRTLQAHIVALREIFVEGTYRHFVQQPSSMFPVGDWVRRVCARTGCAPAVALSLLRGSHTGSSDFDSLDHLDEYADRIITGFDIIDLTLRELPQLRTGTLESWREAQARAQHERDSAKPQAEHAASGDDAGARQQFDADTIERQRHLRERVPAEFQCEFDEGLLEAKAAYGLHDEDVRITYLWPLGLIRRALLAAAGLLIDRGRLDQQDHIFQTTTTELDSLLASASAPTTCELKERAQQFAAWKDEKPPQSFGEREAAPFDGLPVPCARVNQAIMYYLGQMEEQLSENSRQPAWSLMVAGLAASPGRYEGWARVIREASDFKKLRSGDVLVAPTTSPAYNVILPMIGAVVTDRGGALSHSAIVAREFGIPAVVGTNHATSRIPDGARILVDGDRGFVAVRT